MGDCGLDFSEAFNFDKEFVRRAVLASAPYIGLLGPRSRAERLLFELGEAGVTIDADVMQRIYAPVGLDLGSEEPEEIALAIIAEIQAALHHRSPSSLRLIPGPLHPERS